MKNLLLCLAALTMLSTPAFAENTTAPAEEQTTANKGCCSTTPKKFQKGYYGNINLGYSIFTDDFSDMGFMDLQIINGYSFSPYVSAGIGIGVKFGISSEPNHYIPVSIPIFAHIKANFCNAPTSMYLLLNAGYNIAVGQHSLYEGFYIEPALGVGTKIGAKSKINFSLGYALNTTYGSPFMIGAIRLAIGVTF